MNFLKPPFTKTHIIALASLTFFISVGLLFYFKMNRDQTQDSGTPATAEVNQTTGKELREDFASAIRQLDNNNEIGALLVDNLKVIDLRPEEEYLKGHIAGSHNLMPEHIASSSFKTGITVVLYGQDQEVIQKAQEALHTQEVSSIQILTESIEQLKEQGYTISTEAL